MIQNPYTTNVWVSFLMKKLITKRGAEEITEVRSDGGKLLFIKTKEGYEMKCPRTKKICLVKYEEMLKDCFSCLDVDFKEDLQGFLKEKQKF